LVIVGFDFAFFVLSAAISPTAISWPTTDGRVEKIVIDPWRGHVAQMLENYLVWWGVPALVLGDLFRGRGVALTLGDRVVFKIGFKRRDRTHIPAVVAAVNQARAHARQVIADAKKGRNDSARELRAARTMGSEQRPGDQQRQQPPETPPSPPVSPAASSPTSDAGQAVVRGGSAAAWVKSGRAFFQTQWGTSMFTRKQRMILWAGAACLGFMLLYVPWTRGSAGHEMPGGYAWLFAPPKDVVRIDFARLILSMVFVAGLTVAGVVLTRKKTPPPSHERTEPVPPPAQDIPPKSDSRETRHAGEPPKSSERSVRSISPPIGAVIAIVLFLCVMVVVVAIGLYNGGTDTGQHTHAVTTLKATPDWKFDGNGYFPLDPGSRFTSAGKNTGRGDPGGRGPRVPSPLPPAGEVAEVEIARGVKMTFCWIPAGKAMLGSPGTEKERLSDEKEHEYTSQGFWLAKFPVTQEQWRALMKGNPSYFKPTQGDIEKAGITDTSRFPVENVSWTDCQDFLEKMNAAAKLPATMGQGKFVLPHENESEYACRGGKGNERPFYFGDQLNGDLANCDGNYPYGTDTKGEYKLRTTAVGSYEKVAPHPWGLCDMHGNVWQWCENKYNDYEDSRVLRGGSWRIVAGSCRSARRSGDAPGRRIHYYGFRPCFRLV